MKTILVAVFNSRYEMERRRDGKFSCCEIKLAAKNKINYYEYKRVHKGKYSASVHAFEGRKAL